MKRYYWRAGIICHTSNQKMCIFNSSNCEYVIVEKLEEEAVQGSELTETQLLQAGTGPIREMIEKGIVCTDKKDIATPMEPYCKKKLRHLNLLVTGNCNLNCDYCQIVNNAVHPAPMTWEVAKTSIDYLKEHASILGGEKITINLTGGEPLTNWRVTRRTIEYAGSLFGDSCSLVMFTNGILLNDEISDFLYRNHVLVIVSLDGPAAIHNKCRKKQNGEGSYSESLRGYRIAQGHHCKCAISAVANEENLEHLDEFWNWVEELHPISLGFNYPHLLFNNEGFDYPFHQYTDAILYLKRKADECGIFLENYERFKKPIIQHRARIRECQGCGRGMTVDAEGLVGTCKSLLVSRKQGIPIHNFSYATDSLFDLWASRSPVFSEQCGSCSARAICGGGCAYDSYVMNDGDILELDRRMCGHVRRVFEQILDDLCVGDSFKHHFAVDSVGH